VNHTEELSNILLIKQYFINYLKNNNNELGLFEFGVDHRRFDLFLVNANQKRFRGFEFKVSRSDFLADKNSGKWKKYLNYCHTFTWVCPDGLIQRNEVEPPAGLIWVSKKENRSWRYWKKWVKRPGNTGEIPRDKFDKIILLFIDRVKFRKGDFY